MLLSQIHRVFCDECRRKLRSLLPVNYKKKFRAAKTGWTSGKCEYYIDKSVKVN